MKRCFRLRSSKRIKLARNVGRSFASKYLVLIKMENPDINTRCAVIANRSIGGAVARNKAKRILRAIYLELVTEINAGYDLVLIARKPILDVSYSQVKKSLNKLMVKASLVKEATNVG